MNGNAGSNPGNNFIGTSDNKDLVFKTNNLERLRILANGNLKINALAGTGNHSLVVDNDGLISKAPCYTWDQCGNIISGNNFIGSKNAVDLKFKVNSDINNNSVMTIKVNGDIGIGTDAPTEKLEIHHQTNIGEAGGINLVNTSFGNFNSEIKFSSQFSFNPLWAIGNDVQHNGQQNFFIFDHTANSTWGATRFLIDADGNIGVGTESPIEKFQVEGGNVFINSENTGLIVDEGGNKRVGFLKYSGKEGGIWRIEGQRFEIGRAIGVTSLPGTPSSLQADMIIDGDGKVGLGVVPTTGSIYRLFVADGIVTNDILVTIGTFPDFVFDDDYKKHSFAELDAFIKQNKHLPWFPSANEVKKMEGVSVADMQKNMLQSIEELTLLIIELKKEIELLKANQR
jgi:hypothetical protein